jgi:lipopolysaccharide biosynthesis protein
MRRLRRAARALSALWRSVDWLFDYLWVPAALMRRHRDFVRAIHAGERDLADARRVAVFVHFDRGGEVHDYVLFYLRALREAGFEIVLVSNGKGLTPRALTRVLPLCAAALSRENVGYDFGAYRDGLRFLGDPSRFDQVLLANDSVYGPLFDLNDTLARCDDSADLWGITDSWSGRYHLQSFFLLLGRAALVSPRFNRFWNDMLLVQSKNWVIRHYEIGLTQALLRDGLTCTALFPYRVAAADLAMAAHAGQFEDRALTTTMQDFFELVFDRVERGLPLNPMHQFWDHMIAVLRCPFIKRELLARNPAAVPHVHVWERLIRGVSSYDTRLIVRHLQLAARDRAP